MDFKLSDEQVMLQDTLRRYLSERYGLEHRRELIASAEGWSRDCWANYAELGWLSLRVPQQHDGLDCSVIETVLLMEEMGRAMVLEPIVGTAVLGAQLLRSGRDEVAARLLPKLAIGEAVLSLAHAETVRGGRRPVLRTLARAHRNDGDLRLNGRKMLVVGAPASTHLIVSTRQDDALALYVVETDRPGIRLESYRLVDGRAAADVILEDVALGDADLLAAGEDAQGALAEALDWAVLAAMAEALGGMESCLDVTSEYVRTRVQFRQPIGRFQALQHLMADMFVDTQEARSIVYAACSAIDDPARRRRAVAAAQVVVVEACVRVAARGLQMHGGYGMTDEYRISHHYRQMMVLSKLFGDSQDAFERMEPSSIDSKEVA